jgi:hypothetical protein
MDGGEPQGPLRRLLRRLKEHVSSILCPLDARKEGSRGREASRPKGGLGGAHLRHPEGPTRRASPGPPAPLGRAGIIYEVLREQVAGLAILQTSIRSMMDETYKAYRRSVPPSRLALTVRKEATHRSRYSLSWQRLARKPTEFDHLRRSVDPGRKFRRWLRHLKIRNREEFRCLLFRNGLHEHRALLFRFYDRVLALNEAHRTISRRFKGSLVAAAGWRRKAEGLRGIPKPDLVDPLYDHLTPISGEVLEGGRLARWVVEAELVKVEELPLLPSGGRPEFRVSRHREEILRFEWITEDGTTYSYLRRVYSRFRSFHPPGTELPPSLTPAQRETVDRIDKRMDELGKGLRANAAALRKVEEVLAASESTGLDLRNLTPYQAFQVRRRLT